MDGFGVVIIVFPRKRQTHKRFGSHKQTASTTMTDSTSTTTGTTSTTTATKESLADMEARAVAEAKATADAAFRPSPSILNAKSPAALLQQVDGPSLDSYDAKESVYVGRSIPVAAGGKLTVPIQVSTPGSVVAYAMEIKEYDIDFGILAEREEGTTMVRVSANTILDAAVLCTLTHSFVSCGSQESSRVEVVDSPVTQKFLVGTVPCLVNFSFDNEFSWFREKLVSYKITVTPPSKESLAAGRRRRAKACLKAVDEDYKAAANRLEATSKQRGALQTEIQRLRQTLQEQEKSLHVAETEEKWLLERVALRKQQDALLRKRLIHGWTDESANGK